MKLSALAEMKLAIEIGVSTRFWCLIQILLYAPSCNSKGEIETGHHNCLTWRDDQNDVFLTCRVLNFVLPVTFYHEESNTSVICYISDNTQYCTPRLKNYIKNYNFTVTITLVLQKTGGDLDGRWYCKQGDNIQSTKVSLSQGIIMDSWVQLRGVSFYKNGSQFLNVECGSCRKPKHQYAEFFVNNVTIAGIWKNDDDDCRFKQTSCSLLNTCGCSETGNMFFFHLKFKNINTSASLSCHMQFHDGLRRGIFYTITSMIYTGEDFLITNNKTVVVKNNIATNDHLIPSSSTIEAGTPPVSPTDMTSLSSSSSKNLSDTDFKEGLALDIAIIIILVLSAASCMIILICKSIRYQQDSKERKEHKKPLDTTERQQLLKHDCEACSWCMKQSGSECDAYICFDCRHNYCKDCNFRLHDNIDDVKWHAFVKSKLIPEAFSIEIFNCKKHTKSRLEYLCHEDEELLCKQCKESTHSKCHVEPLIEISQEHIQKMTTQLRFVLLSIYTFIDYLSDFEKQRAKTKEAFSTLNLKSYKVSTDDNSALLHKKLSLTMKLGNIETSCLEENTGFLIAIDNFGSCIQDQLNQLKFLSTHAGGHHLFIMGYQIKCKLKAFETQFRVNEDLYNAIGIYLLKGLNSPLISTTMSFNLPTVPRHMQYHQVHESNV